MVEYIVKYHKQNGATEDIRVDGYFNALRTAREKSQEYNCHAIVYVDSPDGFRIKSIIAPNEELT